MTPSDVKTLVSNLDDFIEIPNGIEHLRKVVLTLAVSGKLVPQDPKDGVAGVPPNSTKVVEEPFSIPKAWRWVRLGALTDLRNGHAFKPSDWVRSGMPIIRIQNLNSEKSSYNFSNNIEANRKHAISNGDVLLSWSGTPGTSFGIFIWNRGQAVLNQHIFHCVLKKAVEKNYFKITGNHSIMAVLNTAHGGAGLKHLRKGQVENLPIPLPPFAEQKRIVQKVNDLMVVLDELQARKQKRDEVRARLTQSVMKALGTGNKSLALELLPELIRTPGDILAFEQALLTLAISGKLVPQDSKDVIEKSEENISISPEEIPFEIPKTWKWARLGEVTNYGKTEKCKPARLTQGMWVLELEDIEKDGGALLSVVRYPERESLSDKNVFRAGDVLYGKLRPYLNKVLVAHEDGVASSELMPLHWEGSPEYLRLVLLSGYFSSYVNQRTYGMKMPRLGTKDGRNALVPVPSLSEQKRIVRKVSEITSLINELKGTSRKELRILSPLQISPIHFATASILGSGFERGEMVLDKTLYFIQEVYKVPLGIAFGRGKLGPWSVHVTKAMKSGLGENKYFKKKKTRGGEVLTLDTAGKALLADAKGTELQKQLQEALKKLLPIIQYRKSSDLECLGTVGQVIQDSNTTSGRVIYSEVSKWKKDRFTKKQVKSALDLLIHLKWDRELLKHA